jgi:hypothetical protein
MHKTNREQLDLFTKPKRELPKLEKSLIGLEVRLARACACGKDVATVCSGKGPHYAELRCAKCGAHRMWLRGDAFLFLTDVCQRFGRPTTPVVIRGEIS